MTMASVLRGRYMLAPIWQAWDGQKGDHLHERSWLDTPFGLFNFQPEGWHHLRYVGFCVRQRPRQNLPDFCGKSCLPTLFTYHYDSMATSSSACPWSGLSMKESGPRAEAKSQLAHNGQEESIQLQLWCTHTHKQGTEDQDGGGSFSRPDIILR